MVLSERVHAEFIKNINIHEKKSENPGSFLAGPDSLARPMEWHRGQTPKIVIEFGQGSSAAASSITREFEKQAKIEPEKLMKNQK